MMEKESGYMKLIDKRWNGSVEWGEGLVTYKSKEFHKKDLEKH